MSERTCSVVGCDKLARKRGWCPMHYDRWRTTGDVGPAGRLRQQNIGPCAFDGCDKPSRKRGWCSSHYDQWLDTKNIRPLRNPTAQKTPCAVDGCRRLAKAQKMCLMHYYRVTTYGHVGIPGSTRKDLRMLAEAWQKGDHVAVITEIRRWSTITESGCWEWSGKSKDNGYVDIRINDRSGRQRSLLVHRLSLEAKLGRPLGRMVAHHKCANPPCVNPDHLELATHAENVGEMLARRSYKARIEELEQALYSIDPSHPLIS